MTTIAITVWPGRKEEAEADVYGFFAVHLSGEQPERGRTTWYSITHVQTGLRVCEGWGKKRARALARELNTLLPNGDFSEPNLQDAYYLAFTEGAKALIEKHGGYRPDSRAARDRRRP